MHFLSRLFRRVPSAGVEQAEAQSAFNDMREAVSCETPEQTVRFYLEVAAMLGNKSAEQVLEKMSR